MVEMLAVFCPAEVLHPMYQGCSLIYWCSCQTTTTSRPGCLQRLISQPELSNHLSFVSFFFNFILFHLLCYVMYYYFTSSVLLCIFIIIIIKTKAFPVANLLLSIPRCDPYWYRYWNTVDLLPMIQSSCSGNSK